MRASTGCDGRRNKSCKLVQLDWQYSPTAWSAAVGHFSLQRHCLGHLLTPRLDSGTHGRDLLDFTVDQHQCSAKHQRVQTSTGIQWLTKLRTILKLCVIIYKSQKQQNRVASWSSVSLLETKLSRESAVLKRCITAMRWKIRKRPPKLYQRLAQIGTAARIGLVHRFSLQLAGIDETGAGLKCWVQRPICICCCWCLAYAAIVFTTREFGMHSTV